MKLTLISSIIALVAGADDYSNMYDNTDWGSQAGWEACNAPGQAPIDLKNSFKKAYYQNDMQFTGYDKGWTAAKKVWDKKHALQMMATTAGT
jgi:carbonic anhydrase